MRVRERKKGRSSATGTTPAPSAQRLRHIPQADPPLQEQSPVPLSASKLVDDEETLQRRSIF